MLVAMVKQSISLSERSRTNGSSLIVPKDGGIKNLGEIA